MGIGDENGRKFLGCLGYLFDLCFCFILFLVFRMPSVFFCMAGKGESNAPQR